MLLEFYGQECPHCLAMDELVGKLEKEEGVQVERIEVWHNAVNARRLAQIDKNLCGGVPFFFNTGNNQWVCGEASYEELRQWAGIS